MKPFDAATLRLYLVLDPDATTGQPLEVARQALESGITCLQLRWKGASDREVFGLAVELASICAVWDVPFIVNDRLDIALAAGAQGVHLGVDDLPIGNAADLGGGGFIVGYSPETDTQLMVAEGMGATYIGMGPFAATSTKLDAGEPLGAAGFSRRRSLTSLPVVAIGGITPANAASAIDAGADGIAVASAITRSDDPAAATRRLIGAITT